MQSKEQFAKDLEEVLYRASDTDMVTDDEVRNVMVNAIYGFIAMRCPAKASFTVINSRCSSIALATIPIHQLTVDIIDHLLTQPTVTKMSEVLNHE